MGTPRLLSAAKKEKIRPVRGPFEAPPTSPPPISAAKAQDPTAAHLMAIPTMEMENIYEAGETITDTIEATQAAQDDLSALAVILLQRKQQLVNIRDKLIADIERGNLLPYATQIERMRRCQHIDSLIEWIEVTVRALSAVSLILSNTPRPPGDEEVD